MLKHATLFAAVLALPLSGIQAQERHQHEHAQSPESAQMMMHGMMGQGMMGMGMGMMEAGLPTPEVILQMRDHLGLSEEQVGQLEAAQTALAEAGHEHMEHMMTVRASASEILNADSPDFDAYESTLWGMATHMMQVHLAAARAGVRSREILTPEQRSQLPQHMEMMRGAMGSGMMMSPGMGEHHRHDAGSLKPNHNHHAPSE